MGICARSSQKQAGHVFFQQPGHSTVDMYQVSQGCATVATCEGVGVGGQRCQRGRRSPGLLHPPASLLIVHCLFSHSRRISCTCTVWTLLYIFFSFAQPCSFTPRSIGPTHFKPCRNISQPVSYCPARQPPDRHAGVMKTVYHAFKSVKLQCRRPEWI